MADVKSKIVNVIETTSGEDKTYFTLEGLMIGGFHGGTRVEPVEPSPKTEKPNGAVVRPQTPHQIKRQQEREADTLQMPENRLKHLKEDVA